MFWLWIVFLLVVMLDVAGSAIVIRDKDRRIASLEQLLDRLRLQSEQAVAAERARSSLSADAIVTAIRKYEEHNGAGWRS